MNECPQCKGTKKILGTTLIDIPCHLCESSNEKIKEIERLINEIEKSCKSSISYAGSQPFIELDLKDAKKIKTLLKQVRRFEKNKFDKSMRK